MPLRAHSAIVKPRIVEFQLTYPVGLRYLLEYRPFHVYKNPFKLRIENKFRAINQS